MATIYHANGIATPTVDQKACTAALPWAKLGNYTFAGGVSKSIVLHPATSGVVVADAVKLVSTNPVGTRSLSYSYDPYRCRSSSAGATLRYRARVRTRDPRSVRR